MGQLITVTARPGASASVRMFDLDRSLLAARGRARPYHIVRTRNREAAHALKKSSFSLSRGNAFWRERIFHKGYYQCVCTRFNGKPDAQMSIGIVS